MEVNVFALMGMIGTMCSIVFWLIGASNGAEKERKKELKEETKEGREDGREDGASRSDMKYVMKRVDDILLEQKDTNKGVSALAERVTRTEESLKSLHKRMDGLEVK